MRTIRRAYGPVVAAVSLAALSGCAGSLPCAGVGVVSQVGVYVVQDGYGGLAGASYELCSRGECVKGVFEEEGVSQVHLPLPDDVGPGSGPVRLRVTRAGAGTPLVDDSVDVKLLHQSDGCGGGGYSRGLALTAKDGLLPSVPKEIGKAWYRQLKAEATADPTLTSRTASGTPTG
ncbi:hypothetical protein [Streptomyces sp. NPDC046909]|uniref:hypothetical protein n=1 Tax=Streptomyces sp. NPDC046909 TaxID=3155617 RepID=UPI0033CF7C85